MKIRQMKILAVAVAALTFMAAACSRGPKPGDQSTPTLAYKALYEAVKKKDHEAIKKTMTRGTLSMMETWAGMQKKTLNEVIENGITETTFAPTLPETRNEKITGDLAILEVKNEKKGNWESLPFAKEDGVWKLAIDTFFNGTMSPQGPTNPQNPGQPPVGQPSAPPQEVKPGQQPEGINPQSPPPQMSPSQSKPGQTPPPAVPAPTQGANPSAPPKTGIKPPQR